MNEVDLIGKEWFLTKDYPKVPSELMVLLNVLVFYDAPIPSDIAIRRLSKTIKTDKRSVLEELGIVIKSAYSGPRGPLFFDKEIPSASPQELRIHSPDYGEHYVMGFRCYPDTERFSNSYTLVIDYSEEADTYANDLGSKLYSANWEGPISYYVPKPCPNKVDTTGWDEEHIECPNCDYILNEHAYKHVTGCSYDSYNEHVHKNDTISCYGCGAVVSFDWLDSKITTLREERKKVEADEANNRRNKINKRLRSGQRCVRGDWRVKRKANRSGIWRRTRSGQAR